MTEEKIMIIDGNSILNRAFYGLQGNSMLVSSAGVHTNAVFGFVNILNKYLDEEKPDYLCVAFDLRAPTFRHVEFEGYKAKRKGMPPELAEQVPIIKEVLDAMSIVRLEMEGFEADDIIGSISCCAEKMDIKTVLVTGDRDSLQLVSEKTRVKMPVTKGGRTETEQYGPEEVMARYGVTPLQFIDLKALMGDQSDNIPGVPGVGEKTAIDLVKKFGSIENIYCNLESVEKQSLRDKLSSNKDLAFISKRLATIDRNMKGLCDVSDLKRKEMDKIRLYEVFKKLEFKSLIDKMGLVPDIDDKPSKAFKGDVTVVEPAGNSKKVRELIKRQGSVTVFHLIDKEGPFNEYLAGILFLISHEQAYYFRLENQMEEQLFLYEFKEIFEDSCIHKYGHDLKSLVVYLKWHKIAFRGLSFDTMLAAYIINPSSNSYDISLLAREYLGISINEPSELAGKGRNFHFYRDIDTKELSLAAMSACQAVTGLVQVFGEMIHANGQDELCRNIEFTLAEVLADMEYTGFRADAEGLRQYSLMLDEKIIRITDEIYGLAGEEFNINSPKQLGVILFEKLSLPALKKTKTGYSTDAEVLEQLAPMHPIVAGILEFRQLMKLKSTYAEGLLALINPSTGRIHSIFNQTIAATGRISSIEPNLQNIPVKLEMGREIRKVFIPGSSEYLLSAADYSQIELRVLAHISDDENMKKAFANNEDIHTSTASAVFGIPQEQVTPLMRSRAKAVNFGIVYGIGDFSLSKDLGITRKEARKYIDEYLERYKGVRQYMHDTVEKGRELGYVSTLLNRRRYLPELKSSNFNLRSFGERVAMNTPIQGTAADIIKIAMVKVYRHLTENRMKSKLILQVHDELVIETHIEEKEAVERMLKDCMENAVKLDVPLVVDVKSGRTWYETK